MPKTKEYAYYDKHGYVMQGTKKEIAAKLGISVSTVSYYCSPIYRHRSRNWADQAIRIYPLQDEPYYLDNVDTRRIKALNKEFGYTYADMAEWFGLSKRTIAGKMIGESRFSFDEVKRMEDMYFLEDGELILNKQHGE